MLSSAYAGIPLTTQYHLLIGAVAHHDTLEILTRTVFVGILGAVGLHRCSKQRRSVGVLTHFVRLTRRPGEEDEAEGDALRLRGGRGRCAGRSCRPR